MTLKVSNHLNSEGWDSIPISHLATVIIKYPQIEALRILDNPVISDDNTLSRLQARMDGTFKLWGCCLIGCTCFIGDDSKNVFFKGLDGYWRKLNSLLFYIDEDDNKIKVAGLEGFCYNYPNLSCTDISEEALSDFNYFMTALLEKDFEVEQRVKEVGKDYLFRFSDRGIKIYEETVRL